MRSIADDPRRQALAKAWDEKLHPRDPAGRWAEKGKLLDLIKGAAMDDITEVAGHSVIRTKEGYSVRVGTEHARSEDPAVIAEAIQKHVEHMATLGDPIRLDNMEKKWGEWGFTPDPLEGGKTIHPKSGFEVNKGQWLSTLEPPPDVEGKPLYSITDYGDGTGFPKYRAGTKPIKHVYRGMMIEEYQQALKRGYFRSDQRGTIASWEGTNAATDPRSAQSYLPRDHEGVIVQMDVRPEEKWFTAHADDYLRTREHIPVHQISAVSPVLYKSSEEGLYARGPAPALPRPKAPAGKAVRFEEMPRLDLIERLDQLGVPWTIEEKKLWREELHPRDWHGRWRNVLGAPISVGFTGPRGPMQPAAFPGLKDADVEQHLIDVYHRSQSVEADAHWYEQAHKDIGFLSERLNQEGIDIEPQRLATVVAAMASNVEWETTAEHLLPNLDNALAAVRYNHDNPGADPHELARRFGDPNRPGLMGAVLENGLRAAQGEDPEKFLGGFKLRSFYNNLVWPGETDSVAIDRHMMRAILREHDADRKDLPSLTKPRYLWSAERVRVAAARLGVPPDHLQAAVWSQWLREYNPRKKKPKK
jgi:hypothetical protein